MFESGSVAVVTGVGPGMGRSIALGFARREVDVVLAARDGTRLDAVADEVRAAGRQALSIPTDITDPAACRSLVEAALDRFGRIDHLVQNAHHDGDWSSVVEADADSWRSVFDVNLFGALHLVQAAIPPMRDRGSGSIVLVNSGALVLNPTSLGAYTASKAALAAMARTLANEVGQHGIRVNGVLLGGILGDNVLKAARHQSAVEGITVEEWLERRAATLPLRRMQTPDESAGAVLFLCSELAAAVTGQHLSVNAGQWTS